jgi:hypothetical protein
VLWHKRLGQGIIRVGFAQECGYPDNLIAIFKNSIKPSLWDVLSYVISSLQTRTVGPELLEDAITPWLGPLAPWTRKIVVDNEDRSRNWFLVCMVLSLLLHLALFFIPIAQRMGQAPASSETQGPLTVRLANPAPRTPPTAKTEPVQPPAPRHAKIIASRRPTSQSKPAFTVPPPPEEPSQRVQPTTQPDEATDMMARLNARRAAREAAESEAARENAVAAAGSGGPSLNEKIMANINRSQRSKTDGTGGVFMVKTIGVREGSFIFNGWNPAKDNWHESYTVDAGEGGNVRLAIVKKVIEVIRKYKTGDFEFESHRLGRAVPMSARPADNDRLEAFLMQELFDESLPSGPRTRG